MDGQVDSRVERTLSSMGVDARFLDARTKSQLSRLESAIEEELAAAETAREALKSHELTVSNISKRSGISRATFYNKKILADYIQARKPERKPDVLEQKLAAALERAERAEEMVSKLMRRDGEMVVMQSEMKRLKHRISLLETQSK